MAVAGVGQGEFWRDLRGLRWAGLSGVCCGAAGGALSWRMRADRALNGLQVSGRIFCFPLTTFFRFVCSVLLLPVGAWHTRPALLNVFT